MTYAARVPSTGGRRFLIWAGAGALAVALAACSNGSPKVETTPTTLSPADAGAPGSGITIHINRPTVKHNAKTKGKAAVHTGKQTPGGAPGVSTGTATVTQPGSTTSNTVST